MIARLVANYPSVFESAEVMGTKQIEKSVLPNGIRVVTERMPEARSITLGVLVDASPQHEMPGQSGLAHLTEHLLFQGTTRRNAQQISRFIDLVGGNVGGFTTREYTCYTANVLDEHCPYAMDLLGDILLESIFPENCVESEKQAILREIDGYADTPELRVNEVLKASIWANQPLGRSVVGDSQSVSCLTRQDAIYFAHQRYLPENIIIAAAGHLEHQDLVEQAEDSFWRLLGTPAQIAPIKPTFHSGVIVEHRSVRQAYFAIGIEALPFAHPDRYSMHILTNLLGGGCSSRLFRHLREELGLVYQVGAEYHAYRDSGVLVLEGSTAPEQLLPVLEMCLFNLERLLLEDNGIDEEELWKATMQLRRQHLLGGESSSTRMSRLATQELYFGNPLNSAEVLGWLENIKMADLYRVANEYLVPALRKPAVVVVGPEAPHYYDATRIKAALELITNS